MIAHYLYLRTLRFLEKPNGMRVASSVKMIRYHRGGPIKVIAMIDIGKCLLVRGNPTICCTYHVCLLMSRGWEGIGTKSYALERDGRRNDQVKRKNK